MAEIGDVYESRGELTIVWKIRDFFSLSDEKDIHYFSPPFYFSSTSWQFKIYPNGETKNNTDGWIGMYIIRGSTGSVVSLDFSFSLKKADGSINNTINSKVVIFDAKNSGQGYSKFILRSLLLEKKTELIPLNELTIICTLQNNKLNPVAGSLFRRMKNICDNLKKIVIDRKRTDFTLKCDGKIILAHRMILETRSPVFGAMLSHDTKENQAGEVFIEDIDIFSMCKLVTYMYNGDIDNLTTDNVLSLYAAAHKYDVRDVIQICSEFIIRNLSVQWLCDVIKFAEFYQDEEIRRTAMDYFKENANEIMETENWKNLTKENNSIVIELLSTVVKTLLRK